MCILYHVLQKLVPFLRTPRDTHNYFLDRPISRVFVGSRGFNQV